MLAFIIFVKELMEESSGKDDKNNPCNAASK